MKRFPISLLSFARKPGCLRGNTGKYTTPQKKYKETGQLQNLPLRSCPVFS